MNIMKEMLETKEFKKTFGCITLELRSGIAGSESQSNCFLNTEGASLLFNSYKNKWNGFNKGLKDDSERARAFKDFVLDPLRQVFEIGMRCEGVYKNGRFEGIDVPECMDCAVFAANSKKGKDEKSFFFSLLRWQNGDEYVDEFIDDIVAIIANSYRNKCFRVSFRGDKYLINYHQKVYNFKPVAVRINNLTQKLDKCRKEKYKDSDAKDKKRYLTHYDKCHGEIGIECLSNTDKGNTYAIDEKGFAYELDHVLCKDGTKLPIIDMKYTLRGNARRIRGDISKIKGEIHPSLYGDVSGLSGYITNLVGCATGIVANIAKPLERRTDIKEFRINKLNKEFRLLSNEDNQILMRVWNTLAHHTIGVTKEERDLFDNPVKAKPPFPVDKWGRYYIKDPRDADRLIVYSVNPADIMFAKDVNKCATCFCINSGNSAWHYGMKCLIALNCINKNFGVAYVIRRDDVKKLNQFNGIKFNWYNPQDASFFQYNDNGMYFWYRGKDFNIFTNNAQPEGVQKIYGHDGITQGHTRQSDLAYLETFIKPIYRWNKEEDGLFLTNNKGQIHPDKVPEKWKADIELANQKTKELLEYLEKVKE